MTHRPDHYLRAGVRQPRWLVAQMRSGKQFGDFRINMRNKRLAATGQRKGSKAEAI